MPEHADPATQSHHESANDGQIAAHRPAEANSSKPLSISVKVAIWFGLPLIAGLAAIFKLMLDTQHQFYTEHMNEYASAVAEQLAATAADPLFADASMELSALVNQIPLTDMLVGIAIYDHKNNLLTDKGVSVPKPSTLIKPDHNSVTHSRTSTHPKLIAYSKPVRFRDTVGGSVIIIFDETRIEAQLAQTRSVVIWAGTTLSLFLTMVVIYFSYRITAPVRKLVNAARRMESGDMRPILDRRNDELGQLISSLNSMTKGLAEKSQIKEVLDRFVAPDISNKILNQLDSVNLKGENVNATVLFADIVGFTSLSEKMEPAKVSELLNEYFGYYSSCARLHFGTVDKFLGDCIMIVFGATKDDPQHRYHAASCALLMQELTDCVNQLRQQNGMDNIEIRIGINSGDMLAGLLGTNDRMEYTVLGDAVNLASRLCNEARAGEIILQQELCEQLSESHEMKVTQPKTINVRGKTKPVAIYNLVEISRHHSCQDQAMLQDILERAQNALTQIEPQDKSKALGN